jgi:FkbM family methyltransferase
MRDHQLTVADGGVPCRIELAALSSLVRVLRLADYRGLYAAASLLARAFPQRNTAILSNGPRKFKIHLNDVFYTRLLDGFVYESEIEALLDQILSPHTIFIDCGANQGYWSVYAAQKIKRPDRIVAIEATSLPFERLSENLKLNGDSFTAIRKAVYSQGGLDLEFETHPQRHGSNSCVHQRGKPGEAGFQREVVKSVTIDDVVASIPTGQNDGDVVVKIDVEGAEIEALRGARGVMQRGGLFIYEEHGKDTTCATTDFILHELRACVYLLRLGLEPVRIETVEQLARLHLNPGYGHNLLAADPQSAILKKVLQPSPGNHAPA